MAGWAGIKMMIRGYLADSGDSEAYIAEQTVVDTVGDLDAGRGKENGGAAI